MKIGFDSEMYMHKQSEQILERISHFDKLYLEFGGKLFDDLHAARVLPGFDKAAKIKLLQKLRDKAELIICINAGDIEKNKIRADYGITYGSEVERMIDNIAGMGIYINCVVITLYRDQQAALTYKYKLENRGIKVYLHRPTKGYPHEIDTIVSDEGYGANPYIETTRPLVVATAPGPGSGKLATCLSQLYHEYKRGVKNLLRHPQKRKVWMTLMGKLLFIREVVGPTLRHIRPLLWAIQRRRGLIEPIGEAKEALLWWEDTLSRPAVFKIRDDLITGAIVTDASDDAIGASIQLWSSEGTMERELQNTWALGPMMKEKHINWKELVALQRVLKEEEEQLRGRSLLWMTDNVTARAMVQRQGSQKVGEDLWDLAKEIVDFTSRSCIHPVPVGVPGRLNLFVDFLSRPHEKRTPWARALGRVVRKLGPFNHKPFGVCGGQPEVFEKRQGISGRTLLFPPLEKIPFVVGQLKLLERDESPKGPPISWPRLTAIIVPTWRGATWFQDLSKLSRGQLQLGRLEHPDLERWRARTGRDSGWTAFWLHLHSKDQRRPRGLNIRDVWRSI